MVTATLRERELGIKLLKTRPVRMAVGGRPILARGPLWGRRSAGSGRLKCGYNTAGISLAVAGVLNPIVAAGAMVLSSLSVIGNSLRLGRRLAR